MTQLKNDPSKIQDDQLAEFTDQVLAGKINQTASNVDEELLALEETVLRLKTAFPPSQLGRPAINQMQARLNARIKKEQEVAKTPFWQKWFNSSARPQFAMALAAVAVIALLVVFLPNETTGSSTTATALASPQNYIAVIALLAVVLILWNMRRK